MIGIVKGHRLGLNRDGDVQRVLLQVELSYHNVKTVELYSGFGDDTIPAPGSKIFVLENSGSDLIGIVCSDYLPSTVNAGEREIYSTDATGAAKKAKIKLDDAGLITLNGGTKFAVNWDDLNSAIQALINLLTAHVHTSAAPGAPTSPPTAALTCDLSTAKVAKVKL